MNRLKEGVRYSKEYSRAFGNKNKETNINTQLLQGIVNGDFSLSVTPATLGSSAGAVNTAIAGDGFTRTVVCKVLDGGDEAVRGFNTTLPVAVVATTAGDGDATISGATLTFTEGVASIVITYTGTWAEADTCVFTLGNTSEIAGVSVADKTSTDTLIA